MSQNQGTDTLPETADTASATANFNPMHIEPTPTDGTIGTGSPDTDAPLPEERLNLVPQPRAAGLENMNIANPDRVRLIEGAVEYMPENKETFGEENVFSTVELDTASDAHAAQLRPANTARGYAGDWKVWQAFAAAHGIPPIRTSRGILRAFVAWLWRAGAAPSTIDRRLTGVTVTLRREHHVDVDPEHVRLARELLKDYVRTAAEHRQPPRGRGQAAPLLLPDLRVMSAACGQDLAGLRDRALILLAFAVAARRSELAGLTDADITDDPNGLVIQLRVSKTKPRTVAVPYGSNPLTCPVRAWKAWQQAKPSPEDPEFHPAAFLRIDRHGRILGPMSGQAVGTVITRAAERAGVAARLTGHSARAGLATEARRAGKDRTAIAAVTGHAPGSPVLDRYLRTVDQWDADDNALIGIGL